MADRENNWYLAIGTISGGIAALITFIGVMIAACNEAGWVIGIALGWIPAALAAAVAFVLVRFLWPAGVLGAIWLYDEYQKTL